MKIDLHVHARERSACGLSGEEEMIQAAIERGLDAIAFTDHGRLVPRDRLAELNATYAPFRIFTGIEVTVVENEHVVVLGLHDPKLERRGWTYPDLLAFVHARNGMAFLAHPFRYRPWLGVSVHDDHPDALELRSLNIEPRTEPAIQTLQTELGCRLVCNSDAHYKDDVGRFHNRLPHMPADDAELIEILRAGDYKPGHYPEQASART